ncbi:hypothetical protein BC629DRAFT_1440674 [Irpex lacteus]|nr:hypothetical protein BC629DRAFT_1440674 [Irpex lacteus]
MAERPDSSSMPGVKSSSKEQEQHQASGRVHVATDESARWDRQKHSKAQHTTTEALGGSEGSEGVYTSVSKSRIGIGDKILWMRCVKKATWPQCNVKFCVLAFDFQVSVSKVPGHSHSRRRVDSSPTYITIRQGAPDDLEGSTHDDFTLSIIRLARTESWKGPVKYLEMNVSLQSAKLMVFCNIRALAWTLLCPLGEGDQIEWGLPEDVVRNVGEFGLEQTTMGASDAKMLGGSSCQSTGSFGALVYLTPPWPTLAMEKGDADVSWRIFTVSTFNFAGVES